MAIQFNNLPVAPLRITSRFGKRNTGIVGASTDHKGIDLGGDKSKPETPVLAVRAGTVLQNYWNDVRGWIIVIRHDEFDTLYQHLKAQSPLAVGSKIKTGQTLGIMGASSKTLKITTHLHFEVQVNGVPVNPEPYLLNIVREEEGEEMKIYNTMDELTGDWKEAVEWAKEVGIIKGTSNTNMGLEEPAVKAIVFQYRAWKLVSATLKG